jgi:hypothetical protein
MHWANYLSLAALMIGGLTTSAQDKVAPGAAGTTAKASLQSAWQDLAGEDQTKVARAVIAFGRSPGEAVTFLNQHLRPVKADAKLLERCLRDLDAEDSMTRAAAQADLEYLGKYVKDDLKKAAGSAGSAEARKRIQQLLDRIETAERQAQPPARPALKGRNVGVSNINGQIQVIIDGVPIDLTPRVVTPVGPPRPWVRAARAIGILEGLATPEARQLLATIADGEPTALPTVEARGALERLGK